MRSARGFRTVLMPLVLAVVAAGLVTPYLLAQAAPAKITVSSSVLKDGQPIPKDYTADGKNVSPPITWSDLPAGTKELALICEDPVAPTPQPFVHWVVYKIPPTAKGLPEGMPIDDTTQMPPDLAGTIQGMSGFRRPIWRGPAPPKPGVAHQYHFIVYALYAPLDVQPGLNTTQLLEAMKFHIFWQGELVSSYTL